MEVKDNYESAAWKGPIICIYITKWAENWLNYYIIIEITLLNNYYTHLVWRIDMQQIFSTDNRYDKNLVYSDCNWKKRKNWLKCKGSSNWIRNTNTFLHYSAIYFKRSLSFNYNSQIYKNFYHLFHSIYLIRRKLAQSNHDTFDIIHFS